MSDEEARRAALVEKLRALGNEDDYDPESAHLEADKALLDYIADPEVTAAFRAIEMWYA